MILKISPSQASGTVTAPPSKSMAHRQLIAAALGAQTSRIDNLEWSEDILATLDCLRALGADLERKDSAAAVGRSVAGPTGSVVIGGVDPFAAAEGVVLPCRESGSTLRFLLPLALLSGKTVVFTGSERLFERPLEQIGRAHV